MVSATEPVNEKTIKRGLRTTWLGKKIVHMETTPSTQKDAHEAARNGAFHGTIIVADEQTDGKGRMNRNWYSTKDMGVWMSIILRPEMAIHQAPQLTLMTAVAIADTLNNKQGITPMIKWPNDLLINGRKTAGILTEMKGSPKEIEYVIVGIGINVNQTTTDIPDAIRNRTTSLHIAATKKWRILPIIQEVLQQFEAVYENYMSEGFSPIRERWEKYGFMIGETVQVHVHHETYEAVFAGLDQDGALQVRRGGEMETLHAGEINWPL